jgi:sterol desaturase/sphingolipid hydroxylase (fatty acid hydroxylase superfamily)
MESGLDSFVVWKGVAVFGWLALLFAGERILPAAREPHGSAAVPGGWRRLLRNLGLWAVNLALSPLIVLPLSLWASGHGLAWRPGWWSGGLGLALDLLVLDFLIYWWHRANHVVPLLWRFHEVHHLDRFLDTTTALRFHFGEVLLSALARAAIILLLGLPFASVLVFEALVLIAALFHHSNLRLPPRLEAALARVIITPSIHWVHHHAVRRDTDSNYGTILSIWDPLFGSRSATRRSADMVIGVEQRAEAGLPALLARPFWRPEASG